MTYISLHTNVDDILPAQKTKTGTNTSLKMVDKLPDKEARTDIFLHKSF